ncbi:MAG: hypothetical protein IPK00_12040 [Deltaproteobacteria bacterium]|nr:hypothetical protein [Deltaproteobacteria bacterium]
MHDRIAGVPPSAAVLSQMAAHIGNSRPDLAAELAMQNPAFYNVSLKNFVTPWTNEASTVFAPLNDYTATVIGMVRDDVPFNLVLSEDIIYTGANNLVTPNYEQTSNAHYEALEEAGADLSNPAVLVRRMQSTLPGSQISANEAAGVVTTRAAAEAFFSGGTNRAMWRFTAINYLCRDMEQLHDVTRPGDWIRQDVSRSPGGDSEIFLNNCYGCHAGMDSLAGAYAYFEWDATAGRMIHTPGVVQAKNLINGNVFPYGHITTDNGWVNLWREGSNSLLGWRGASDRGFGAKSLGAEIGASRAFSVCQVEKVFKHVCFHGPKNQTDRDAIEAIADTFEENGEYNLKDVFAGVAAHCMNEE